MPKPPRWRCSSCDLSFTAWAKAQRHADESGHRRIEYLMEAK